ncbi:MAG: hypothetical protein GXP62_21985 [Oligoflexia bacterium]|nr:hypothetical protein [Oligoflexia bacterium]
METPDLPGGLVVYDSTHKQHMEYRTGDDPGFTPVSGHAQGYAPTYNPLASPDHRYTIAYNETLGRYLVSGDGHTRPFAYYCFAPSQIAWSPDSDYIAYRADGDQSEWTARIVVVRVADGHSWWIGNGESPRWGVE